MLERRGLQAWASALVGVMALGCGKLNTTPGGAATAGGQPSTRTDDGDEVTGQAGNHTSPGGAGGVPGTGVSGIGGIGGVGGVSSAGHAGTGGLPSGGVAPIETCMVTGCPGGLSCIAGNCRCPDHAPTYCQAAAKCIDLTSDPDHCGACTTQCSTLSACEQGKCTVEPLDLLSIPGCDQLTLQRGPDGLYVLSLGTHSLTRVGLPLGGPVELTTALSQPAAFTLGNNGFAYVVSDNTIKSVNLTSGATALVTQLNGPIADVAFADGTLYYAADQFLRSIDASVVGGAGKIRTASNGGVTQGVAVSGEYAVFVSMTSFNVESLKLDGGQQATTLAASQGSLLFGHRSVQVDVAHAFWANGTVQFRPKDGGAAANSAGPARGIVTAFAIDGTDAGTSEWTYFASFTGELEKAVVGSERATWMARGLGTGTSIVLDDQNVYVATKDCHVWQTPR
jgi:hypothetical protein